MVREIGDRREPERVALGGAPARGVAGFVRGEWEEVVERDHGALVEQSGRGIHAGAIPALGEQRERPRVRDAHVSADAPRDERPVGRDRVEFVAGRTARRRPARFVEAFADEESALAVRRARLLERGERFVERPGVVDGGARQPHAELHEVGVRVLEAGEQRPAAELPAGGPLGDGGDHLVAGADAGDAAVSYGDGVGFGRKVAAERSAAQK